MEEIVWRTIKYELKRQTWDDDEEDIQEQREEIRNKGIIIKEYLEAIHMLKRSKATGHDNIPAEMLQNMRENDLIC